MLPAIAAHAVAASRPGDLVLDPMCGIGTTIAKAGRDAIGVEYESRWSDIAGANIAHAHTKERPAPARSSAATPSGCRPLVPTALAGRVALVVTSPPYGPTVHGLVRPGADGVAKLPNDGTGRGNLAYRDLTGLTRRVRAHPHRLSDPMKRCSRRRWRPLRSCCDPACVRQGLCARLITGLLTQSDVL
jgi:modification methylase